MKHSLLLLGLLLALISASFASADANPFPHRDKYSDVPVMDIQQLRAELEAVLIVDVRSRYEFDTLHIKGAINVPLNSADFVQQVRRMRQNDPRQIVFYCNGGTCKKSYKATRKAMKAGVKNCVAYDAGIYAWAQRYPEVSVLLGESPMRQNAFIDNAKFKSRLLTADQFEARMGRWAIVLDIRDRVQRDSMLFPFKEKRAELDESEALAKVIAQAKRERKALLVYDKVGKQARWFQYYLEKQGIKNYYFMKGGSEEYYESKLGKFRVAPPGEES